MKPPIKKIATGLSLLILFLFVLSYYSHLVYEAALKGKDSGFVAHHLTNFANYPERIKEVLKSNELAGIPSTFLKIESGFKEVNHLNYDLYAVNSFWNMEREGWDIKFFNLKNNQALHSWTLDNGKKDRLNFETTNWSFANAVPRNCIVLSDRSLIISTDESANLLRLDSLSHPIWINHDFIFHHSLNLDADSNIWACTADLFVSGKAQTKGLKNFNGKTYNYKDNYITQINKDNGKIEFHKSVTELLIENGYINFVYGFSDPDLYPQDPMHLNDVQPILTDGLYWKKGDLLLSIRDRSLIVLYRPSTNKILRLIYGPFLNQHDVDVFSDHEISVFNNNYVQVDKDVIPNDCTHMDSLLSSEIVVYNLKDSTYRKPLLSHFVKNNIWTETQGMHRHLKNGDFFVECQNKAQLFILNENNIVLKKIFPTPVTNYCYHTNWIRIYETKPF